ncbi:MAG: hypothetical protein K0R66_1719 [Gammaproteobacteria bacterium]|jgi:hypothetical protein|nr:hypothetical protein [Gammaproteobacteria bacterium]
MFDIYSIQVRDNKNKNLYSPLQIDLVNAEVCVECNEGGHQHYLKFDEIEFITDKGAERE